jgi:hypothetical protein
MTKTIKLRIRKPANEQATQQLLEMARVDNPNKDTNILGTKEIWVYGDDRSSMSPHFHYFDKRGNKKFDIEVRINDLTVCFSHPRKGIKDKELYSWVGLRDEYKALMMWLKQSNSDMPSITNYDALILAWNQNNRSNQI